MIIFSVELKNQPGELAHFGEVLGQRGVNMELAGVTTGEHGTILFNASDEAAARTALEGAGIEYTERPALQVKCLDQAGEARQDRPRARERERQHRGPAVRLDLPR